MQHNASVSSNSSKNWIQPALSWRVFFVKLNSERVHWTLASHRHLAYFTTEHGIAPQLLNIGVNDGSVQLFCRC